MRTSRTQKENKIVEIQEGLMKRQSIDNVCLIGNRVSSTHSTQSNQTKTTKADKPDK